ncbi:similar to Saccharomyces cerevisiae YOR073W SGO1 Component of the spindle checkpoint, involved in sensing lack of tension on mitotic chromosomes [Maudiozyma barnettii]|uniref:Similar to Saccharomyces cerevisiae YOR073W SGO1 Component of the spindle checkpoint, involved in sensing lack of tension on mitotic chromosomes n=1 Tax=Maudiozyma barnettii TaxID=61262 RepID=A0A8H2VIN7_9SACH|nr:Sgo1p [Kazachstania barnettii]CAB4256265.1 similar to Saccharomyces cerevisiae YOR073W SGO1 Component of the spindle checkpoint, involved in sensing lack of tension on mitotic chromosomes [Kazachstania barnettii]CAD1784874.1 similar to Saccharomyces cerevisiae YOR073W SGO1 Component of the spindle checkpoint, involved in sensing lack of tension on mitotic chromosomes [Kazachstania barnettii]
MTRTVRSSGSKNSGSKNSSSKNDDSNNTSNTRSYQLQFQELQDILDQESEKLIHLKTSYIQQNVAIAKENSLLKIKLNEMETKVSGLIQENVAVRSHLSMAQLKYKQQLTDKLQNMEQDLLLRFQSILDMFQQVRVQENLPAGHSLKNALRSTVMQLPPSSLPTSKDSHTVHTTLSGPSSASSSSVSPSVNSTSSRKRRKSSRRQSMFVPSDFEFPVDNDLPIENNNTDGMNCEESIVSLQNQDHGNVPEEQINDETDFTNSIIDYSIPEENDAKRNNRTEMMALSRDSYKPLPTSFIVSSTAPPSSSSLSSSSISTSATKLNVFKDDEKDIIDNEENNNSNTAMKHSIRPPRIKNKKRKIIDEKMPVSKYPEIDSSTRRTRGKTVDYKLPSLRSKMRRPSEKFVDAITTINIKDLQVNKRKRKSNNNDDNNPVPEDEIVSLTSAIQTTLKNDIPVDTPSTSSSPSSSMLKDTIFKKKQLIQPKSSSPLVDKDINKKRPSSQKKKLFKHAIINDLNDEMTTESSANSSRANKSVSFRLNEEDLSVFDLIPTKTATPKTYKNTNSNSGGGNINNSSTTSKISRL